MSSYFSPAYVYGGPIRSLSNLFEGLAKLGAEITVVTTNANGKNTLQVPLRTPVHLNGVIVWYLPRITTAFNYFYAPEQENIVEKLIKDQDIVIAGSLWGYSNIVTTKACHQHRMPYVIPLHGQLNPWALKYKGIKKKLYMGLVARWQLIHASAIQCTDSVEIKALKQLGIETPTILVPLSINLDRYIHLPYSSLIRDKYGIGNTDPVLLFLGRLSKIKRPDLAIMALSYVLEKVKNTHLIIAGPDEENLLPRLEKLGRQMGVGHRVHFTGLLQNDEILDVLTIANLLIIPSEIQENFGMSGLEALAVGVPIITTKGIPVGHIAQSAGAGIVVSASAESISEAVVNYLLHPNLSQEAGERGKLLVKNVYRQDLIAERALSYYEELIAKEPG